MGNSCRGYRQVRCAGVFGRVVLWRWAGAVFKEHTYQCCAAGRNTGCIYEGCRKALSLAGTPKLSCRREITKIYPERDTAEYDGALFQLPLGRENVAGRA